MKKLTHRPTGIRVYSGKCLDGKTRIHIDFSGNSTTNVSLTLSSLQSLRDYFQTVADHLDVEYYKEKELKGKR